ncbi:MAG: flippase-like domain-containing protein, partial [Bdellovibrionales bacterium]|nr:flippase-like domain-containing protein [Bdellovibrionales bacterium]
MTNQAADDISSSVGTDLGPPRSSRSRWKLVLRLSISVLLLVIVLRSVHLPDLVQTLLSIHPLVAVSIIVLYALGQVISAMKWRILFTEVGIQRSPKETIRAYFSGMFVNTFGLGTVGGDVVRGLALQPAKGRRASALASVVADRVHGLMVLSLIGAVAIVLVRPA